MAQQRKRTSAGHARQARDGRSGSTAPTRARTESSMRPKAVTQSEASRRPETESDGYDADEGPLDTGLASESVELSEILDNAAADGESLSVDAEDLGSHTLRAAVQQDALEGNTRSGLLDEATLLDTLPQSDEFDELEQTTTRDEAVDEEEALDEMDALEEERAAEARDAEARDAESDPDSPGESTMEPAAVDLAQNEIRNGSLFDQPRKGEAGQVRHPLVKTNEADVTLDQKERAQRARRPHRPSARRGKH